MRKRENIFTCIISLMLLCFSAYVLLDTFVITHVYTVVETPAVAESTSTINTSEQSEDSVVENSTSTDRNSEAVPGSDKEKPSATKKKRSKTKPGSDHSSSDSDDAETTAKLSTADSVKSLSTEDYSINIKEYRENDTSIYVADIVLNENASLQTAFAQNAYGKNVTAKTSDIAESVGAVLAINGDYYGAQEKGYVIRNGVLYRNTADSDQEDLVIYQDGSFEIINESEISAEELLAKDALHVLSFGPGLVSDGEISVTEADEVGKAKASNPRTAIGMIDENHYVFVVSDGRTDESEGLSLLELAEFIQSLGVKTAYNLDGGGSSTMYFNGEIINNPTTTGSIKERSVSDIVYIR